MVGDARRNYGKTLRLLEAAILGVTLCAASLNAAHRGAGRSSAPEKRAPTFIGYSLVTGWNHVEAESLVRRLATNGLTGTEIEYITNDKTAPCPPGSAREKDYIGFDPEAARRLIESARIRRIVVFVNLINWNDCAVREQSDEWFRDRLNEVLAIGTDGVWLSPVSEPWSGDTEKAHRWARMAQAAWFGVFVLANQGRESTQPAWSDILYDYLDAHPCSDAELDHGLASGNERILHTTDCGPILNPGRMRAARFTREALAKHSMLNIYDFAGRIPDSATIRAMGRQIK